MQANSEASTPFHARFLFHIACPLFRRRMWWHSQMGGQSSQFWRDPHPFRAIPLVCHLKLCHWKTHTPMLNSMERHYIQPRSFTAQSQVIQIANPCQQRKSTPRMLRDTLGFILSLPLGNTGISKYWPGGQIGPQQASMWAQQNPNLVHGQALDLSPIHS